MKLLATHPGRLLTLTLGGNAGLHPAQQERHFIVADALEGKDITAAIAKLKFPDGRALLEPPKSLICRTIETPPAKLSFLPISENAAGIDIRL